MKTDKLIDAIGMIKDDYIQEARQKKKLFTFSFDLVGKLATAGLAVLLLINIFPALFKSSPKDYATGNSYYQADEYAAAYSGEMKTDNGSSNDLSVSELMKDADKKLILTANMYMESQNLDESSKALFDLTDKYNGYIQSSSTYTRSTYTRVLDATIRIPADKYTQFIEEVKQLGNYTSYSEQIDDITDSYTDLNARLNSLKSQEEKVLQFYDKAETIEDLMAVESRLSELRYQIEYYEAQIKNYDLLTAYSTLNISITETKTYTPTSTSFFKRLANAFTNGFENFTDSIGDFLIDVVYNIWTILALLILGFIGYFIYKKIRNRK